MLRQNLNKKSEIREITFLKIQKILFFKFLKMFCLILYFLFRFCLSMLCSIVANFGTHPLVSSYLTLGLWRNLLILFYYSSIVMPHSSIVVSHSPIVNNFFEVTDTGINGHGGWRAPMGAPVVTPMRGRGTARNWGGWGAQPHIGRGWPQIIVYIIVWQVVWVGRWGPIGQWRWGSTVHTIIGLMRLPL